jgi:hypothetical protein
MEVGAQSSLTKCAVPPHNPGFEVGIPKLVGFRRRVHELYLLCRQTHEVIARGIFTSVQDLLRKLMRYIRAYSKTARPFKWKYSDARSRIFPC